MLHYVTNCQNLQLTYTKTQTSADYKLSSTLPRIEFSAISFHMNSGLLIGVFFDIIVLPSVLAVHNFTKRTRLSKTVRLPETIFQFNHDNHNP